MKSRPKPRVIPGSKPAPRPRPRGNFRKTTPPAEVEICILAGGLSTRMGRDKANLRIGGRTLLAHIRSTAKALGLPVRVIRCDLVPRCGPLGGIYTALKTTAADAVLFLACDMPCVTETLLQTVLRKNKSRTHSAPLRSVCASEASAVRIAAISASNCGFNCCSRRLRVADGNA